MSTNPASRPRVPRAEREVQILDEAEALFAERGLHGSTMVDIADRVGITKPLIYDYFGSKERLLAAVAERARGRLLSAISEAWLEAPVNATIESRIEGGLRAFFVAMERYSGTYVLLQAEGALVGEAAAVVERVRASHARGIAAALGALPGLEDLPELELEGIAEVFTGACDRLTMWRHTRPDVAIDDIVRIAMGAIWNGVARHLPEGQR